MARLTPTEHDVSRWIIELQPRCYGKPTGKPVQEFIETLAELQHILDQHDADENGVFECCTVVRVLPPLTHLDVETYVDASDATLAELEARYDAAIVAGFDAPRGTVDLARLGAQRRKLRRFVAERQDARTAETKQLTAMFAVA